MNKKGKKQKEKKSIQEEMEEGAEEVFKKMDIAFFKYYGKMCPQFEKDCVQCRANLIYNNFKSRIWEELVRK
jgi:aspartate-semialdehyde dehydrogenase